MLKIRSLAVKVNEKIILEKFNLEVKPGEIHALMGLNGAGKSTICKAIMHDPSLEIFKGSIKYNDQVISKMNTYDIAKLGIFLLNQSPLTIEGVTNAEMLRVALSERNKEIVDVFKFKHEMEEACDILNIPREFIHRAINDGMSGGERKKNELLHLWMLKPSLILLDELDSGLDVDALKDVCNAIRKYDKLYNPAIIIVTHHTNILKYLKPDYVHVLNEGRIIKTGGYELAKKIEKSGFTIINEMVKK